MFKSIDNESKDNINQEKSALNKKKKENFMYSILLLHPSACSWVQVLDKVLGTGNVESTSRFRPSHFLDQVLVQVLQ